MANITPYPEPRSKPRLVLIPVANSSGLALDTTKDELVFVRIEVEHYEQ